MAACPITAFARSIRPRFGRAAVFALSALLVAAVAAPARTADEAPKARAAPAGRHATGQFLVAAPDIGDPRFQRSVVYMIRHNAEGAFGVIVNRPIGHGPLDKFLAGFKIEAGAKGGDLRIHYGGPVEQGLGFVVHTGDWQGQGSARIDDRISWTPRLDVLAAISNGEGPKRSLFALGYAGWGPSQLEGELARGDWSIAPADEDLIFEGDGDATWEKARARGGRPL